ncbi:hypothetical protein COV20_01870 [Candidatus Woesearchaeota archaeon CG10_big_fil_rev_8_21_14_0_10_45_16]|nr:MAG: hypothetical protein COV20_01870 [Candidatus Woesearchaeota archaeon CG10_big_fil_rev_8_21_14_0_10_45_16]
MRRHNKRGITPLMGTILLVSFAVAVGVVVMNFGRAEVEDGAQCAIEIGLKLANIGGVDQVCYNAGKRSVDFTIENGVNIKVEGFIFNVIGENEAKSVDLSAAMAKLGNYLGSVPYDTAVSGAIRQVKITPKVVLYDEEQICVEETLVAENVRNC